MTDPVAVLTGKEEQPGPSEDREVSDAPVRTPEQEEVADDAGIEEQMAKRQGPFPGSDRTQVERDQEYVAESGGTDPAMDAEGIDINADEVSSTPPEGGIVDDALQVIRDLAERTDAIADLKRELDSMGSRLDAVAELRQSLDALDDSMDRLKTASDIDYDKLLDNMAERRGETREEMDRKFDENYKGHGKELAECIMDMRQFGNTTFSGPRNFIPQLRTNGKVAAFRRIARIAKTAGDSFVPKHLRCTRTIDMKPDLAKIAEGWEDTGWSAERVFKLEDNEKEIFKTACQLEMVANKMCDHQFTSQDSADGLKMAVDRHPEMGFNLGLTTLFNGVYDKFQQRKTAKDQIEGGLADDKPDAAFDKNELAEGIEVEVEHTDDIDTAKEIAKDHLTEDGRYYEALEDMEENLEKTAYVKKDNDVDVTLRLRGRPSSVGGVVAAVEAMHRLGSWGCSRTVKVSCDGDGAFGFKLDSKGLSEKERGAVFAELVSDPEMQDDISINTDSNLQSLTDIKQTKEAKADLPLRRRVEVIVTDGLNVWGQKQPFSKGGIWFPGGGVDSRDEKFADAAARECVEESGLRVKEIFRLARIPPIECFWDKDAMDGDNEKWQKKAKQWRGDRTHIYVANVKTEGKPTSREGDAMEGDWIPFGEALGRLRSSMPFDNNGWKPLTRARVRALELVAPPGLKVPRRSQNDG